MKCFNHPATDAIGICKNCNKGLCRECLTEIKNGIACTSTCVEEVKSINNLIQNNKSSGNRSASAYNRNAFIYGALGLVFFYEGFAEKGMRDFMFPAGAIFLIGAIFMITTALKYKRKN